MKVQMAYCSACDRDVQIGFPTEPAVADGQANIMDTEVFCLEIGTQCTGALCPIGAQPPAVMAVRLIHNGMKPLMYPMQRFRCDTCNGIETFVFVDTTHATCTGCGGTVDRSSLAMPTSN
jgi:hypothetical protein